MDKALQMACSETVCTSKHSDRRRTKDMLLAKGGSGVFESTPSRRNKRKETTTIKQKEKGRKAEAPTPKGKVSAKAKNSDGSSPKRGRPKLYDKDRQPDRGAEGADRTPRRSASELAIEWIGSYCPDGQPHFLIGKHNFDGGVILNCRGCGKNLWLPTNPSDAAKLDILIDRYGVTGGYRAYLDKHREAKCLVAKLQDLWYAEQRMEDNGEFMKLVISVMEDKEYDRASC